MKMQFHAARVVAAAFLAVAFAGTAWAHATLQSATPAKDAVVAAPKEVTLKFNEKLEAAFSSAKVLDSSGKVIETGKATLDETDPSVMKVNVPKLSPGKYTVQYVVVGHDGHRRKGEYAFSVK